MDAGAKRVSRIDLIAALGQAHVIDTLWWRLR